MPNHSRRKLRTRFALKQKTKQPIRLSVFRSNKNIYAQIIDDIQGNTLASASSIEKDFLKNKGDKDVATFVGELISVRAKEKKVSKLYFDRGSHKYHGNVKKLADSARKNGLEF